MVLLTIGLLKHPLRAVNFALGRASIQSLDLGAEQG
jgi:hypothetical protein